MELKAVKGYEALYFRMVNKIATKYDVTAYDVIFGAHEYSCDFGHTKWVQEYCRKLRPFNEKMANMFELSPQDIAKLHRDIIYNIHAKLMRSIIRHINLTLLLLNTKKENRLS